MACVDATVLPVLALESLSALLCVAIIGQWLDLLSAMQPTFAVRENGLFLVYSLQLAGFVFNLQLAAFKSFRLRRVTYFASPK